jgi:hypothetical protein
VTGPRLLGIGKVGSNPACRTPHLEQTSAQANRAAKCLRRTEQPWEIATAAFAIIINCWLIIDSLLPFYIRGICLRTPPNTFVGQQYYAGMHNYMRPLPVDNCVLHFGRIGRE